MSSLISLLHDAAEASPAQPALLWRGGRVSYASLAVRAARAADALVASGVVAGDRIALVAPNVPDAVALLFALWEVGAIAVPVSDRLQTDDRAAALSATAPVALVELEAVATGDGQQDADAPTFRVQRTGFAGAGEEDGADAGIADDIALILTTSGSTGTPKAVPVTHRREVESAASMVERLRIGTDDVTALAVSISHAFGLSCLLAAVAAGSATALVDSTTSSAPLLDALEVATLVHGSPTLFAAVDGRPRSATPHLRAGFSAGSGAPPALLERLDAAGARILNLYGMTEIGAAAVTRLDDDEQVRWTTSGTALAGHELRVVDGELHVRGSHVCRGYFRQPERTAAAWDADGWFRTGDLAELDADGHLRIVGRRDDVVTVAGFNVSPAEVELCLLEHPAVAAALVVGVPDDRLGHRLVAAVVPTPGSDARPRDLLAHVRSRLAGYKVPYRIEHLDDLPRLPTGKPDRRALHTLMERDDR